MQFIVTIVFSGVVAVLVTAILNSSMHIRTFQISRLEELVECLFSMIDLNDQLHYHFSSQVRWLKAGNVSLFDERYDPKHSLPSEYTAKFTRAQTLCTLVEADSKLLHELNLKCLQIAGLPVQKKGNDLREVDRLKIERDQLLSDIILSLAPRIKRLQNPFRVFVSS